MIPAGAAALVFGLGALYALVDRYRQTSHGDNPWTVDGFLGVTFVSQHIDRLASEIAVTWTSAYRSPAVQQAVYAAKRNDPAQWAVVEAGARARGMTPDAYVTSLILASRHTRGLAADFVKTGVPTAALADRIFAAVATGQYGPVKKVLDERDHVHVEWFAPWEPPRSPVRESL